MDSEVGHYCGVFGIFGHPQAVGMTHQALQALQHRGQESAGIAASDGQSILCERGIGLVEHALTDEQLRRIDGRPHAIGHVRYSTSGGPDPRNAQPLSLHFRFGPLAIGHNGDLVNKDALRRECEQRGAVFQTSADTETIIALMAGNDAPDFERCLHATLARLEGAYSLVLLRDQELHAVRDPLGFRPLSLGRIGDSFVVASETCAFSLFGAEHIRDLEPGEHLTIDAKGMRSTRFAEAPRKAQCVFEHVYFARPDSRLFGRNVHQVRVDLGRRLAIEHPADADLVIAVPESGSSAAQGFAAESGLPLDRGFVKNHYVGRTFIKPTPEMREAAVRLKLSAIPEIVQNKRLVVVDDSVVRGTTGLGRMRALREAGAREIHLRISCPPTQWPCFYGIDFPTRAELIAAKKTVAEIAQHLGVDSLGYLSLEGLHAAVGGDEKTFCSACFDGRYPTPLPPEIVL